MIEGSLVYVKSKETFFFKDRHGGSSILCYNLLIK